MPRRERPAKTERSEHWLRVAVNERTEQLNELIERQRRDGDPGRPFFHSPNRTTASRQPSMDIAPVTAKFIL